MCKTMEDLGRKMIYNEKLESASRMLSMEMTVEQISKALNIPIDKVLELKEQEVVA